MMKHRHIPMRLASMLLVLALFAGLIAPANATGANSSGAELRVTRVDNQEVSANVLPKQLEEVTEIQPASTDRTRVSIVLEKESTSVYVVAPRFSIVSHNGAYEIIPVPPSASHFTYLHYCL